MFTQGKGGILAATMESYTSLCSHERLPLKKKTSEIISLEVKKRETATARDRARGRGIGGHLLTFLRVGGIKALTLMICPSLCVNTQSRSRRTICSAAPNQTLFQSLQQETERKKREEEEFVCWSKQKQVLWSWRHRMYMERQYTFISFLLCTVKINVVKKKKGHLKENLIGNNIIRCCCSQ